MIKKITYCGFITIVGRTNVGKSTLINQLLGQKISITSQKPHTTRYRIMGIHTDGAYQAIYVDTPGLHVEENRSSNRVLNRVDIRDISDVELVIFVVEGTNWRIEDEMILKKLRDVHCSVLLAINKVDKVVDKKKLLPYIHFVSKKMHFYNIVPICAKTGMNSDKLANIIRQALPEGNHHFPENYIIDRSQSFMASEMIREKLMRFLGDELPYSVTVDIEYFAIHDSESYDIHGVIIVERDGHKKIIIGNKGNKIKIIGIKARQGMEAMFKRKVRLKLWIKSK